MSELTSQSEAGTSQADAKRRAAALFDLSAIDLDGLQGDTAEIERWIPHRGEMALLDGIVWMDEGCSRAVGRWDVRDDEFWVDGHFPGMPLLPGVLQLEAGAQLGCYLYNNRMGGPRVGAFIRIENAVFRRSVHPGERLFLLAQEVKTSQRRFISDIQGLVDGQVAFEARITGMNIDGPRPTG